MEIKELIERAKELDKQATPGPWMWDLRTNYRDVKIVTTHSGQYYVMSFERFGMQGAAPCFQVYDKYDGPVNKRGSHGMFRADKLAKSYPGKEHHKGFDDYPDHPDAKFIVESRQLVTELIAAVEQLSAELELVTAERENPKPLTLDELRKMDWEPVWCLCKPIDGGNGFWCICKKGTIIPPSGVRFDVKEIPNWVFLRSKPKE